MPYSEIYQLKYMEFTGETVQVNLYKKSFFVPDPVTPVIHTLTGSDQPFVVSVIDNDKDKFKAIRAKRAIISFVSEPGLTAITFSDGEDNEWFVEAIVESTNDILFRGFIIMDDNQESFLDPEVSYTVRLTATDNIGTLKEVALTKPDGTNPRGDPYKIIEYLAWALQKTGLQLDIIVCDTWMEYTQTDFLPAFDSTYLEPKTFEKKINTSVDCYRVLEIILGKHLFITQRLGVWWIGSVDEMAGGVTYRFRFDYEGNYIEQLPTTSFTQTIGFTEDLQFINKDCIDRFTRPHKFVKLNYNYDSPIEIIDNIDFSRGALIAIISLPPGHVGYEIDDWTIGKYSANSPTSPTSAPITARIERVFVDSYEKERYLVMPVDPTSSGPFVYLRSNAIYVGEKDKGTISVDYRRAATGSSNFQSFIGLVLFGDDGNKYAYNAAAGGIWNPATIYGTTIFTDNYVIPSSTDKTKWNTVGFEFKPVPTSGRLFVFLKPASGTGGDVHYANLQFDYHAFINGSYQKYTSQYFKVSQSGDYKANVDDDVYITDSPKRMFKGALLKKVGSNFILTTKWHARGDLLNLGITPPISSIYDHPYGHLQVYAVWNQCNRRMIELEGSIDGLKLSTAGALPDLIHNYTVNASGAEQTENKVFVLVSCDQDFRSGRWRGVLIESFDTTQPKDYTSPNEFKYE